MPLLPTLRRLRPVFLPVAAGLVILAAWQVTVTVTGVSSFVLPSPGRVASVLVFSAEGLREHAYSTTFEMVLGLVIAIAVGIALAVLLSLSRLARDALYPNLVLFQLIPKIALAPLFIVWLGIGIESRLTFALFLAFFPILVASTAGLMSTDPQLIRLCRALRASNVQIFFQVRMPYALPHIFSGVKIGATMAMIGVVVGEFITGQIGLGYIVMFAAFNMDTALMFAAIIWLSVIGVAIYGVVVGAELVIQRRYGRPVA